MSDEHAAPDTEPSKPGETREPTPGGNRRAQRILWGLTALALLAMLYYVGLFGYHWREEVVLHDGTTIIATRWATRGGRHEIGQSPPIKKMTLGFTHPDTGQRIT